MKHWKISYSVQRFGEVKEKDLILEAATIDEALSKARGVVARTEMASGDGQEMDRFVIWDVGIMEDDVF